MNDKAKKYFDSLKGKKVAFVGMGVANIPCAEFFAKLGIDVYACDKRDKDYIGKDICGPGACPPPRSIPPWDGSGLPCRGAGGCGYMP